MCWVPSSVSRMRKRSSGQLFFVLLKHHDHRLLTEGISETHPFGSDADAGHVRGHLAYPLHPLRTLLRTKVPLSASLILGSDSLYRLDMGGAPNEQHGRETRRDRWSGRPSSYWAARSPSGR